jgi:hypothetical protein
LLATNGLPAHRLLGYIAVFPAQHAQVYPARWPSKIQADGAGTFAHRELSNRKHFLTRIAYAAHFGTVEKIVKPGFAAKQRLRENFSIGVLPDFSLRILDGSLFVRHPPSSLPASKEKRGGYECT